MSIFDENIVEKEIASTLFKDWYVTIHNINFNHQLFILNQSGPRRTDSVSEYIEKNIELGVDIMNRISVPHLSDWLMNYFKRMVVYILQDISFTDFEDASDDYNEPCYRLKKYGCRFKNRVGKRCREFFNINKNSWIGKNNTHFYINSETSRTFYNYITKDHFMNIEIATYSTNFDKKIPLFKITLYRPL